MIGTFYESVLDFMQRMVKLGLGCKQTIGDLAKPGFGDTEMRMKLIWEEAEEFVHACGYDVRDMRNSDEGLHEWHFGRRFKDGSPVEPDFILAIDALCDILYVVFGSFVAFGLRPWPFYKVVHESNIAKLVPGAKVREDGKLIKAPDWKPPDLATVLVLETEKALEDART